MKVGIRIQKMGISSLVTLLLLLFCCLDFTESKRSKSACYYYGHSCWGGHGKRSGNEGLLSANKVFGFHSSPVLQMLMRNKGNSNSAESFFAGRSGENLLDPNLPYNNKNSHGNAKPNSHSGMYGLLKRDVSGKYFDEGNEDKAEEQLDDQDPESVPLRMMQNKRGNDAEMVVVSNDRVGSDYDSAVGNSMNSNVNANSGATEEEVPIYYPSSSVGSSEIFSRNNRFRDRASNHSNVKGTTSGSSPTGNMILFRWVPVQKTL